MDFSHLIRGTREFFQGHPGKPKDNGVGIAPPFINFPEAKNGVKMNHETSYNLQSHSQVIKSNCPTQPSIHGTVSQYYPAPYSKNFTSKQQSQSSQQVDEFHAPNMEVKHHTWIQSTAVYPAHTPRIPYAEQKVWQQTIYSEDGDVSSNTRLNYNPPIPAVLATNPRVVTPASCQGHQQQVSVKNNECMVPAVNNLHRELPESGDCSSYSSNFVRPAFVQDFRSKNIHQSQRTVASRDNVNLMSFRESGFQPTFGKFYNQPLHLASDRRNQAEHTPASVSCDCLFNRPCPLHRYSKQQDIPTLERQSSEWGSKIQNISIENKLTRQKYEYTSLGIPDERPKVLQNPEMMKRHQTPLQQNYQIQELPKTTSSNIAFASFRANVEADVPSRLSTDFRPHRQAYLNELSGMRTGNNLDSEVGGVSVIQQPKNCTAVSSVEATKKNEERMSVINYPKQRHLSNSSITLPNVLFSKNGKNKSISADVLVSWPKKELATHECKSLQSGVSQMQQNQVCIAVDYSNNRSPDRQPDRITNPPNLKMPSLGKSVIHISSTDNFLIDATPIKSDPIVSDEKWEEWKSSFDTEWNAFVQDLAASGNIKRIHRVTQPIPRKIKRREKAEPKPIKRSLDTKLLTITDFSSDEDIPLSLRRKTKEDKCNKIF